MRVGVMAAFALFAGFFHAGAQFLPEKDITCAYVKRFAATRNAANINLTVDGRIDVIYYKLDLTITTFPHFLTGRVTVTSRVQNDGLTSFLLNLRNTMTIDSVTMDGIRQQFVQQQSSFSVELNRQYLRNEMFTIDVYYRGTPVSTGFGSFQFGLHGTTPWVWSLSQPYGASDWWPCKDHPSDKADSVDIWVTCRSDLKVGSNGKLVGITANADGTHTFKWSERYPIATYLVSLAVTNYAEFSQWFRYSPLDSMEVLNYILPENFDELRDSLRNIPDMLRIFSDRFGLYPFIREKYGHAQFGLGGAMEHQTMTSLVRLAFSDPVLAHELAHQWFGDLITCATWPHLWLNEGFASYSESIFDEGQYGIAAYHRSMQQSMNRGKSAAGSVFKTDTTDIRQLFDQATVYRKGASVLHMLRHVLGDTVFFRCIQAYVAHPQFRYGTATTEDLQHVCETVSGKELGWFFSQWIYGEQYPHYTYGWHSVLDANGNNTLQVRIQQRRRTVNPSFFTMPIDCRISSEKWDTTVVLFNNAATQEFSIPLSQRPTRVELDPDVWILRDLELDGDLLPATFQLLQNYPNPFNPTTTIRFSLPPRGTSYPVSLRLYDLLGREVAEMVNETMPAGSHTVEWNASGIASGVYLYALRAGTFSAAKKMIVIR